MLNALETRSALFVATYAAALTFACVPVYGHEGESSKASTSSPSMDMHRSMMKGMKEMQGMKPSGNMDQDFAMMMRHHHMQAVRMAEYERGGLAFLDTKSSCVKWMNCSFVTAIMPTKRSSNHETVAQEPFIPI